MKTMLMFDRLVNLHRERHRDLRLDLSVVDSRFAAHTNSVPIAASEVAQAVLNCPCVFVETGGRHALVALLGLDQRQNLFVGADGRWLAGAYMPAFLRRYPFALAETEEDGNYLVCIDEACPGLATGAGEPLFEAQDGGEPVQEGRVLREARGFLLALLKELEASSRWCDQVVAQGLLEDRVVRFTLPDGSEGQLTGFKAVNEERLRALPADVAARWLADGTLGLLFAHLVSLGQIERLATLRQQHATPGGAAAPSATPAVPAA